MIDKLEADRIEKVLIGTCLLNHDALLEHAGHLRPEDFCLDSNRHLWATMLEMLDAGESVDYLTVGKRLQDSGLLAKIGGWSYVTSLGEGIPLGVTRTSLRQIVVDLSQRRKLRGALEGGTAAVDDPSESTSACLDVAQTGLLDVATERERRMRGAETFEESCQSWYSHWQHDSMTHSGTASAFCHVIAR